MSLEIDCKKVRGILLADGWHQVTKGTFDLDAYEFYVSFGDGPNDSLQLHGGGQSGVSATGFQCRIDRRPEWSDDGDLIAGPLSSILAIRYAS